MSGFEQPSREELLALIESQARVFEELRAEVVELKRRWGRNSGNSSQPPSADGPAVSPSRAGTQAQRPQAGQTARRGRIGTVPDQHPG